MGLNAMVVATAFRVSLEGRGDVVEAVTPTADSVRHLAQSCLHIAGGERSEAAGVKPSARRA